MLDNRINEKLSEAFRKVILPLRLIRLALLLLVGPKSRIAARLCGSRARARGMSTWESQDSTADFAQKSLTANRTRSTLIRITVSWESTTSAAITAVIFNHREGDLYARKKKNLLLPARFCVVEPHKL